eukprot:CAMPEP_0180060824 /NCGR_PEP_ID=MMETSP0985-20121206/6261_1 /TAXON_ID=483367 /ORGANISM="non described non described, Strain CCMP 2436" /LENGTH=115 /DNA_ID=CAMNT_0021990899 /DNA_START=155 /DNA_END=501 /DNA_ORIENTATION=-
MLDAVESGVQTSDRGRFLDVRGIVKNTPGHAQALPAEMDNRKNCLFDCLACTAWHGPPLTLEQTYVKHKDSDPSNNTPANLERATPSENTQHPHDKNPNLKVYAGGVSKPVRGRK